MGVARGERGWWEGTSHSQRIVSPGPHTARRGHCSLPNLLASLPRGLLHVTVPKSDPLAWTQFPYPGLSDGPSTQTVHLHPWPQAVLPLALSLEALNQPCDRPDPTSGR